MLHITIDKNLFTLSDCQAYVLYNLLDNACMNYDNDLDNVTRSDFVDIAYCLRDCVRDSLSFCDRFEISHKFYGGFDDSPSFGGDING